MYVLSVRDKNGYYIPVIAGQGEEMVMERFEKWKEEQKNNKYWTPEFYLLTEPEVI